MVFPEQSASDADPKQDPVVTSSFNLDLGGTDPMIDRLRRKRHSARHLRRLFSVVATTMSLTWLVGGLVVFGVDWLRSSSTLLFGGAAFGAIIGLCVVAYAFWTEIEAKSKGKIAVWNIRGALSPQPTMRSVIWLKVQFAILTVVICGLVGACFSSVYVVLSAAQEAPFESTIVSGVALFAAALSFWLVGLRPRTTA